MDLIYILSAMGTVLLAALLTERRGTHRCPRCRAVLMPSIRGLLCPGCGARSEERKQNAGGAGREGGSESPSTALFDKDKFHAVAQAVEAEWMMGGLVSTIYEDFARECCERYLSNARLDRQEEVHDHGH